VDKPWDWYVKVRDLRPDLGQGILSPIEIKKIKPASPKKAYSPQRMMKRREEKVDWWSIGRRTHFKTYIDFHPTPYRQLSNK
jgi:hypothetical protein